LTSVAAVAQKFFLNIKLEDSNDVTPKQLEARKKLKDKWTREDSLVLMNDPVQEHEQIPEVVTTMIKPEPLEENIVASNCTRYLCFFVLLSLK
jgi:hypothetical protein